MWELFLFGNGGGTSGDRFPFGDNARCWGEGKVGMEEEADVEGDDNVVVVVLSGLTAMVLVVVGYCCCKR